MKPTNDVTKVSYRLNWFVFSIGLLLTTQDTNKNNTLHENKAGSSTLGYAIKRDLPADCSSLSLLNCLCRV